MDSQDHPPKRPLRTDAPLRVLDGFGRALQAACRYAAPRNADELAEILQQAASEKLSVTFRGSGQSYGDAALNQRGLVVDLSALKRVLRWEPQTGIIETEPGLTIEGLWRRTIEDGYWPAVVPGTMKPTLGGCLAMNVHGKNNFKVGPIGDHVLELDLMTASGERLRCSRTENTDVFHAAIGGMGLLGAITRVKMSMKRIESGRLRVLALAASNLDGMFDTFERTMPGADYVVGWIDAFASGRSAGRGQVHVANYLHADEDPEAAASLHVERQGLPPHIMGVPRAKLWPMLRFIFNNPGIGMLNAAKYAVSRATHGKTYLQSHVAFAFLLDYVPNWRLAYGDGGLIQYQVFVPHATARDAMRDVLELARQAGLPPYLGVLKRHRPDPFLLTHALDGWSLALDFRVTAANRAKLWALTKRMTDRVLRAGGKFYFAKDAVLSPSDVEQAYGRQRLDQFLALKKRLDPGNLLSSDLFQRTMAR